jgi:hypothetical protein
VAWLASAEGKEGGAVPEAGEDEGTSRYLVRLSCLYTVFSLKDRRGDQRGGEWEPIKIPQSNLVYIPKSTQIHNKRNPAALKPSLAVEKNRSKNRE